MLNFTGTLPRDFAPAFPDFPKNGKLPWEERAVPWNRLKKAFRETLGLYQSMSPEIVVEIRSTFLRGRLSRGQNPYFSPIDSWAARQYWTITTHLRRRPLHFFLFLQWCLLDTENQPMVAELQYAYANFCGSSSMGSYVTAAVWVVRNQILMAQEVPAQEVRTRKSRSARGGIGGIPPGRTQDVLLPDERSPPPPLEPSMKRRTLSEKPVQPKKRVVHEPGPGNSRTIVELPIVAVKLVTN